MIFTNTQPLARQLSEPRFFFSSQSFPFLSLLFVFLFSTPLFLYLPLEKIIDHLYKSEPQNQNNLQIFSLNKITRTEDETARRFPQIHTSGQWQSWKLNLALQQPVHSSFTLNCLGDSQSQNDHLETGQVYSLES